MICLEPDTDNYHLLVQNITNSTAYKLAISDKTGMAYLNKNQSSVNHKISEKGIEISTISMIDLINKHEIQKIDLLKIDIEGHEDVLFKNISTWIDMVENIIIELHDTLSFEEFEKILQPYRFKAILNPNNMAVAIRVFN